MRGRCQPRNVLVPARRCPGAASARVTHHCPATPGHHHCPRPQQPRPRGHLGGGRGRSGSGHARVCFEEEKRFLLLLSWRPRPPAAPFAPQNPVGFCTSEPSLPGHARVGATTRIPSGCPAAMWNCRDPAAGWGCGGGGSSQLQGAAREGSGGFLRPPLPLQDDGWRSKMTPPASPHPGR